MLTKPRARRDGANKPYHSATVSFLETQGHIRAVGLGPYYQCVLLFLIAIVLLDLGLKEHAIGLIFGFDKNPRLVLGRVS